MNVKLMTLYFYSWLHRKHLASQFSSQDIEILHYSLEYIERSLEGNVKLSMNDILHFQAVSMNVFVQKDVVILKKSYNTKILNGVVICQSRLPHYYNILCLTIAQSFFPLVYHICSRLMHTIFYTLFMIFSYKCLSRRCTIIMPSFALAELSLLYFEKKT